MKEPKEIHLMDKQIIINIMDKVEDNYDFTSEDSRLMAFTYLWDELKEVVYAKKRWWVGHTNRTIRERP